MDSPSGPTDPDSEGPKINGSVAGMWLWSLQINETVVNKISSFLCINYRPFLNRSCGIRSGFVSLVGRKGPSESRWSSCAQTS